MKDQRAEALAQILVRYSTHVEKGDVCVIQSTTAAEVLVQAVYEEVLRAGGHPIIQLTHRGRAGRVLRATPRTTSSTGSLPLSKWATENADVRIAIMADVNARELRAPTRGSRRAPRRRASR